MYISIILFYMGRVLRYCHRGSKQLIYLKVKRWCRKISIAYSFTKRVVEVEQMCSLKYHDIQDSSDM